VLLFSPPIAAAASALLVFRRSFPTRLIVFLASLARLCPAVGYQTLVSIFLKSNVFLLHTSIRKRGIQVAKRAKRLSCVAATAIPIASLNSLSLFSDSKALNL